MLALLEFSDFAVIAGIVTIFAGGAAFTARQQINLARLERDVAQLHQKLDALLAHHGVQVKGPPPSGLSREVEQLARDPNQKIAAIKRYREENPGTGLAEAKVRIEEFYRRGY